MITKPSSGNISWEMTCYTIYLFVDDRKGKGRHRDMLPCTFVAIVVYQLASHPPVTSAFLDQSKTLPAMSATVPRIIYGTAWKKEATTDLVVKAVLNGFRAIDTACQPKHYR
jgi:hypothetical protein